MENRISDVKGRGKAKRMSWQVYFLGIVLALYVGIGAANKNVALESLRESYRIMKELLFPLIFMVAIMAFMDYFVSPQKISEHFGAGSGGKAWLLSIIGGIISTGPIYAWYPLLKSMKNKGARGALISVFLYNRAIKIPLLPIMAFYFGLAYTVILWCIMILVSVPEGILTEKIERVIAKRYEK